MKPETDDTLEHDPGLHALQALPREDLDAARSERLRRRAHAELRRRTRGRDILPLRAADMLEPLLFAGCAATVLVRLAGLIAMLLEHRMG